MLAARFERESRPCDQILHRACDQYLARLRLRGDPGADRDRDPRDLAVVKLALTGVNTCTNIETELADALG